MSCREELRKEKKKIAGSSKERVNRNTSLSKEIKKGDVRERRRDPCGPQPLELGSNQQPQNYQFCFLPLKYLTKYLPPSASSAPPDAPKHLLRNILCRMNDRPHPLAYPSSLSSRMPLRGLLFHFLPSRFEYSFRGR